MRRASRRRPSPRRGWAAGSGCRRARGPRRRRAAWSCRGRACRSRRTRACVPDSGAASPTQRTGQDSHGPNRYISLEYALAYDAVYSYSMWCAVFWYSRLHAVRVAVQYSWEYSYSTCSVHCAHDWCQLNTLERWFQAHLNIDEAVEEVLIDLHISQYCSYSNRAHIFHTSTHSQPEVATIRALIQLTTMIHRNSWNPTHREKSNFKWLSNLFPQ